MSQIISHTGLTLLEAHQVAKRAGMYLIDNGTGDVKVSPVIPPGWREIPIKVKITAPDRGCICTDDRAAA